MHGITGLCTTPEAYQRDVLLHGSEYTWTLPQLLHERTCSDDFSCVEAVVQRYLPDLPASTQERPVHNRVSEQF